MHVLNSSSLQLGTFGAVVLLAVFIAVLAAVLVYFVVWALRRKPVTGSEALVGKSGTALTDMRSGTPGEVMIDGVIWRAEVADASFTISKNETAVVLGISSLTLIVGKDKPKSGEPKLT
ncbi:MAG: NfeD family protein [Nitrososphaerota archaeon]|jgi:membrane-bound serine protease (ClpP class)|nr:NfeD family protein [Nitrososphaerota archaeon]MDG7000585.1 NfeD family protein [Nitrososphaerota archaeon]